MTSLQVRTIHSGEMLFDKKKSLLTGLFAAQVLFSAAVLPALPQAMEITVNSVSHKDKSPNLHLKLYKHMGVTSIQTYIYWNAIENELGVVDWTKYDADVALFKKQGLKWVPFLIVGPWYVTPEFVRQDKDVVMFRCLEHSRDSAIPSIWSPRLREYVRGFLKMFSDHYSPMGIFESINLGISGDYGEAIYPAIGNWPTKYHSHPGFWCGDDLAAADFRRAMSELYQGYIGSLNRAWKSHYHSFEEVAPFLPQDAPSRRSRLEFLGWYRDSMTRYAEFWLSTARELFPATEIYLCTGGDMAPEHGSDFSAQAKLAAKYGAGIRITNETSSFPHNFGLTRLVDSACRFYGAYFGHEPASTVTPVGYLGRIFNAVTSGARQLFYYSTPKLAALEGENPVVGNGGRFQVAYKDLEKIRKPEVAVALLYPTSSSTHALTSVGTFGDIAAELRRLVDYDLCDERMVQEGALEGEQILIVAGADILESRTLAKIQTWVSDGGLLFVLDCRSADWDGQSSIMDGLEGFTSGSEEVHGISELTVLPPKRLSSIAALPAVFVSRAFTGLAPDIEPLLAMKFAPEGSVAWSRVQGNGKVYAYFGPMDLKKKEESWMESYQLPLLFLKDCFQDSYREGRLKKLPLSLISNAQEVYIVETTDGLFALNMSPVVQKVQYPGGTFEIGAESIKIVEKKR